MIGAVVHDANELIKLKRAFSLKASASKGIEWKAEHVVLVLPHHDHHSTLGVGWAPMSICPVVISERIDVWISVWQMVRNGYKLSGLEVPRGAVCSLKVKVVPKVWYGGMAGVARRCPSACIRVSIYDRWCRCRRRIIATVCARWWDCSSGRRRSGRVDGMAGLTPLNVDILKDSSFNSVLNP